MSRPSGVRREQGNDAVDELIEGLVLLREQGNRAACYWLCPVCEQKFHSSRDFLGHVEMVHEGLAVQVRKWARARAASRVLVLTSDPVSCSALLSRCAGRTRAGQQVCVLLQVPAGRGWHVLHQHAHGRVQPVLPLLHGGRGQPQVSEAARCAERAVLLRREGGGPGE
jgi:hypothetical protein